MMAMDRYVKGMSVLGVKESQDMGRGSLQKCFQMMIRILFNTC